MQGVNRELAHLSDEALVLLAARSEQSALAELPLAVRRPWLFRGGGTSTIVRLGGSVPAGAKIGVTVERAGGAAAPTQAPIFTAQA